MFFRPNFEKNKKQVKGCFYGVRVFCSLEKYTSSFYGKHSIFEERSILQNCLLSRKKPVIADCFISLNLLWLIFLVF